MDNPLLSELMSEGRLKSVTVSNTFQLLALLDLLTLTLHKPGPNEGQGRGNKGSEGRDKDKEKEKDTGGGEYKICAVSEREYTFSLV